MSTELLDKAAVCALLGGSKPIHGATLYRHIRNKLIPKPIRVGGSARWIREEVEGSGGY